MHVQGVQKQFSTFSFDCLSYIKCQTKTYETLYKKSENISFFRAWSPDRTITQSRKYVGSSLGQKFAEPVILNMEVLYNESRALTPMICFLSIGSDPSPYIEQLAKRLEFKVKSISMGQGQEVHARKMMSQAMSEVKIVIKSLQDEFLRVSL